jgi:hypothetical protein
MDASRREVSLLSELLANAADGSVREIVVTSDLTGAPMFRLSPGQALTGTGGAVIRFGSGQDGVQVSSDNRIEGLELRTAANRCAVFNDVSVERIGRLELRNLRATGLVRILASDAVRGGHVEVHDLDIIAADARGYD